MSSTTDTVPAGTERRRLHGLDALRALALGLGIVLHTMLAYIPDSGWLVTDSVTDPAAGLPVYVIHLFRMTTFMLLAGYFGAMMLGRRGPGGYLRDRLLRIGLPLVVFWPISVGGMVALVVLGAAVLGTPVPVPPEPPPGTPTGLLALSPGQLWFLLVLMEIIVVWLVLRAVATTVLGAERVQRLVAAAGGLLAGPAGMPVATLPYLVALLVQGSGGGIVEPRTLVPSLPALIGYGGAFAVGWALHAHPESLRRIARAWPVHLGIAVLATVLGVLVEGWGAPLVVSAGVTALAGTAWTYGLLGLFAGVLDRYSPTVRYLSDSAYWVYLLHLPVLIGIQLPMADLPWPIPVKVLVTWVVAGVLLLVSYDVLVRGTWVGRWLNGRRHRPVLLRRGRAEA